jgi:hypothetical protein
LAENVFQEVFVKFMKGAVGGNKLKVMYENITFNSRKLINGYMEEFEKVNLQK